MPSRMPLPARRIETRQSFLPASSREPRPLERRVDLGLLDRQVARRLISEQQADLAHQPAELRGRSVAVAHQRQFVLDERVIDDGQISFRLLHDQVTSKARDPRASRLVRGRGPHHNRTGRAAMSTNVADWLQGLGLQQYAAAFAENDIDGDVLPELTADDLSGLGVASIGHRRRLLAAIAALREDARQAAARAAPGAAVSGEAERRQLRWSSPRARPGWSCEARGEPVGAALTPSSSLPRHQHHALGKSRCSRGFDLFQGDLGLGLKGDRLRHPGLVSTGLVLRPDLQGDRGDKRPAGWHRGWPATRSPRPGSCPACQAGRSTAAPPRPSASPSLGYPVSSMIQASIAPLR